METEKFIFGQLDENNCLPIKPHYAGKFECIKLSYLYLG
jgi:hypothetical protein